MEVPVIVPDQPEGSDQVYAVAPGTGLMLKAYRDPEQ
jgi:hypothetical protein